MRGLILLAVMFFAGCKSITSCFIIDLDEVPLNIESTYIHRSEAYQKEIDLLIAIDAENKRWERIYIKEIKIAEHNLDRDAFKFFMTEYINIPRLRVPKWMWSEPGYAPEPKIEDVILD